MSKGNMLLGHARGKVGDLVFSRSNGQQIVRSRAAVVKNPQTEKQMIQRIILNTVAQAYSRMQPIADHSFEGVQEGAKSMAAFMKKNLQAIRQFVQLQIDEGWDFQSIFAFTPVGQNSFSANAYVVSTGSLPEVAVSGFAQNKAQIDLTANTYAGVIEQYGLQRGDQLTFMVIDGTAISNKTFHYARVILDPTNADGSEAPLSTPFIVDGAVNLPSPRNNGEVTLLSYADGKISFAFSQQEINNAGVIVSRQGSDGTWRRSNCTLALNDAAIMSGYDLQTCLDAIEQGSIALLNDLYLNNSGTGALANTAGVSTAISQVIVGNNMYTSPSQIIVIEPAEQPNITVIADAAYAGKSAVITNAGGSEQVVSMGALRLSGGNAVCSYRLTDTSLSGSGYKFAVFDGTTMIAGSDFGSVAFE